ncbi:MULTISPECIES: DUF2946 domain-containing protein [Pseudomonas]|uniref:DUF2946 domain-containing protein n=1 Tax=Pseudomonas TaxID=286 RepID=UPI00029A74A6|nr:DUF2946 domain-containing protein [Pseudomonas donghuensis]MCP3750335.1 DUF2946 domain-containing protein [Pseudomonas sp. SBB6]MBF4206514.1 DUF2946 domain-containing protein [Pseudomonas donghuensis]PJY95051.1 DUF2946 domain-containing protein [Pseudomonas donghuensis]UVL30046.1 DUF2946 domain-containing protein [Pseudomonas donghuensis]WKY28929.1 DUF2946 domain-containing protein [Pseudomonas donghuensis]
MTIARSRFSHTARPESRTVRGSWLSLFAMLMIFIGPLVSQSMPMDHRAMPAGMSMDSAADYCHADSHHGGSPALKVIWEKCGYCSLFFHCPALPQALSLLNTEAVPASHRLLVHPRQGHARQTVFPGARSRAPPSLIVV